MNTRKTESIAVETIRMAVSESGFLDGSGIQMSDKGISFDGHIVTLFDSGKNEKEKYSGEILVQIKGRSEPKKGKSGKAKNTFPWERAHLENALKEGGAILFVVDIMRDGRRLIHYADLLPANIGQYLANHKSKTIAVKLKPIPTNNATMKIEGICRKFLADREAQRRLDYRAMFAPMLKRDGKMVLTIKGRLSLGEIERRLSEEDFYYPTEPRSRKITGVIVGKPDEIIAVSKDAKIGFDDETFCIGCETHFEKDSRKEFRFDKAFSLNLNTGKFSFKLVGTLSERIRQIEFCIRAIEGGAFYIEKMPIAINLDAEKLELIKLWRKNYSRLRKNLSQLRVKRDPDLDEWSESQLQKADAITSAIVRGEPISIAEQSPAFGNLRLGNLTLAYFFVPEGDVSRVVDILEFDDSIKKEGIRCYDGYGNNPTDNLLCLLHESFYLADNFDFEKTSQYIESMEIDENAKDPLNAQGLWMIKAFDKTGDERYLDLAGELYSKLAAVSADKEKRENMDINRLQIKARRQTLSNNDLERLVEIKDNTLSIFVSIGCLILLGSFKEAHLKLEKLTEQEREWFGQFPIIKLLS